MSRRPNIIPSVKLTTRIPMDVMVKLDSFLYSEVEGRIPLGAYQKFFVERIQEFFAKQEESVHAEPRTPSQD